MKNRVKIKPVIDSCNHQELNFDPPRMCNIHFKGIQMDCYRIDEIHIQFEYYDFSKLPETIQNKYFDFIKSLTNK